MQFHLDKAKILSKADLKEFLEGLKNFGNLIAPKRKGEKFVFDRVENVDEVELNYTRTVLPPKKFLLPYRRERFSYNIETLEFENPPFIENQVIFGIHSCDLHGITILDSIYLKENPDPKYLDVIPKLV